MRHQSQKHFWGIFVGISQHQKGYLIYVPSTCKIVSSNEVAFDEFVFSALSYTSRTHSEALIMRSEVSDILYAASSHEKTGNIITFAQFEEGNVVETNIMQQNMNKFRLQLMSHRYTMNIMTDL